MRKQHFTPTRSTLSVLLWVALMAVSVGSAAAQRGSLFLGPEMSLNTPSTYGFCLAPSVYVGRDVTVGLLLSGRFRQSEQSSFFGPIRSNFRAFPLYAMVTYEPRIDRRVRPFVGAGPGVFIYSNEFDGNALPGTRVRPSLCFQAGLDVGLGSRLFARVATGSELIFEEAFDNARQTTVMPVRMGLGYTF